MAKIKLLKECPLMKDFTDKDIAIFSQIVSEKRFPKNTPLFVENMLGDSLFIIKSGSVEIKKNLSGIGEQVIATLGPGDFFGEMAILDGGQRLTSAKTTEDTELLIVAGDDFKALMEKEPMITNKFIISVVRSFAEKIRENIPLLDEFLSYKLKVKKS